MYAIQVSDLRKSFKIKQKQPGLSGSFKSLIHPVYQKVEAVCGLSFEMEPGELLGFIGPNGAGKSTTIKILTGILHPSSGEVNVLGYVPWKERNKLSFQIGTVFGQRSQLWYHLPAIDTFNLLGKVYEIDDSQLKKRISFLADSFDLNDLLNIPVRKLSLGQRMRCEVAASLLHQPRILLLDEPSIGLDVIAKQRIRDTIKQMNQLEGVGILLTSHDAGDLEALCHKVIVIHHGKIIYRDKVSTLKRRFLTHKLVEVRYATEIQPDFYIEGTQIIKVGQYGVKMKFDTRQIQVGAVIAGLASQGSLVDLSISDPTMEEVIRAIYTQEGQIEIK